MTRCCYVKRASPPFKYLCLSIGDNPSRLSIFNRVIDRILGKFYMRKFHNLSTGARLIFLEAVILCY